MKQNAKQESDRIVKEAGQIKDNAIGDANQLSAEAASKTKAIETVSRRINRTPRRRRTAVTRGVCLTRRPEI